MAAWARNELAAIQQVADGDAAEPKGDHGELERKSAVVNQQGAQDLE